MLRAVLAAVSTAALLAGPAFATGLIAEQTVLKVVEVTTPEGEVETELVSADLVAPGETVQYALSYMNEGADPIEDVVLTMPVPEELRFIDESAQAPDTQVTYSIDGGATFANRTELLIDANGELVPATAEDITHIRWAFTAPIETGEDGAISFQAVLR